MDRFVASLLAMTNERMPVMSVDTVSTKPKLVAAEPQLFVADVTASCAFFKNKLGFTIVFTYGEPPYYAQVKRDGAALNLRCVEGVAIDPLLRDREELLSASITLATADEITQLARDFERAGVSFAQALAKKPWGALDFIVRDIDGNLLLFAGPAES
jgi:uncharacterized glyoxalase superfamily protein PhnB